MTALGRVLDGFSRRSGLANPSGSFIEAMSDGRTVTGRTVSIQGSLSLVPVFSTVSLIASSVGSLPLIVYKRGDDGSRERAPTHRTWRFLHDNLNEEQAADDGWETITAHILLWGNAFAYKIRNNPLDLVDGLLPINPKRVQVTRTKDGVKRFVVDGDLNATFTELDILHFRGLSTDGLVGLSPIREARNALGIAAAQEEFQGQFLDGGGKPGVILKHPSRLSDEAAKRLERSFDAATPGSAKLLEENMTAEKWTMPLEDAQFLESIQFSDLRIAQLFNLPPHFLGAKTGDSLTYATTEGRGIDYVTYTLRRWLVRIEKALRRDQGVFAQGDRFFAEFLTDALTRADIKTRFDAYRTAIDGGWMLPEEVRDRENLPRRELPQPSSSGPSDP